MTPRLLEQYRTEIVPAIKEKFNIRNSFAVPRLEKIVVNMGVGEAVSDIKLLEKAIEEMALITGQKPQIRKAKLAISNFKLRKGMSVGCRVTLRRVKMYEFMDRLINVALPRIRDFNGVPRRSFDKAGNFSLGIKEQTIFPEIEMDRINRVQGLDVSFVFNRGPQELTYELLRLFGMPFTK